MPSGTCAGQRKSATDWTAGTDMDPMTLNYNSWQDGEATLVIEHDLPVDMDQSVLTVKANYEGLVLDFFQNGELTATMGMTYEEWFELAETFATKKSPK